MSKGSRKGKPSAPDIACNVIASGSSGNAVVIGNILIDCGIPYHMLKDSLYDIDFLLITHEHSDHVNKMTLNTIIRKFPNIKIYSNYRVARLDDSIVAINVDYLPIYLDDWEMYAIPVPHNVLTYAYVLLRDHLAILYATDLSDTESLEKFCLARKLKFDYLFLEANYDPDKLKAIGNEWHGQYNPYVDSTARHLSTEQSLLFYARFKKEGCVYVQLHKSRRFY